MHIPTVDIAHRDEFNLKDCLFIGIDPHKDSHYAVASSRYFEQFGEWQFSNRHHDIDLFIKQMKTLAADKSMTCVFGLEDTRCNGGLLTKRLLYHNNTVYEVHPALTSKRRQQSITREKSDQQDAIDIVEVLIKDIDKLTQRTTETENELFLSLNHLSCYRDELVKEQTALQNQLHDFFHFDQPNYKELFKTVFSKKALRYWKGRINRIQNLESGLMVARAYVASCKLQRLFEIQKELQILEQKLEKLVNRCGQRLETLPGARTVTAASILSEVGEINRFGNIDKFIRYAGIAPKEKSSGNRKKFVKAKIGNRRLNKSIYLIALTQIRCNKSARNYFLKKVGEGKTKRQAITHVMRRIATIIYGMLKNKGAYRES